MTRPCHDIRRRLPDFLDELLDETSASEVTTHLAQGLSIDEIAAVLECSPATVRVHLHRGRRTLATRLSLDLEEPDET